MMHDVLVECPYCGERYETTVDTSEGNAEFIQDCEVCCRPIEFVIEVDAQGNLVNVTTLSEDD
jgi:hypothetical protein